MKWNRKNLESGVEHLATDKSEKERYKVVKKRHGLYEVFLKCTPDAKGISGRPFPAHFNWYYLTNFRNPGDAKKFVEGYDKGLIGLTPFERERYDIKKEE